MRRKDGKGRYIALVPDKMSDDIVKLANKGLKYRTIGDKFGLTEGQVKAHLWYRRRTYGELARGVRPWTTKELVTAQTLSEHCGISTTQIGQLLGRSKHSVVGALWRRRRNGKRSQVID